MEDKDYATPLDGEKKQNDTGESPDLASYYASAASAAATGHEFRPDEPEKDKTDEAIAAADDASATDDAASETSADADAGAEGSPVADSEAPENDAQNAGTDANEPSDISGDGSPHGPLDLFSESPEDNKTDDEAADEADEKDTQEPPKEPALPYENAPAFAPFQAPEKVEDKEDDDEPEGAEDDVPMSILGHLNELRRRLFRIVIIVVLGFVAFYGVSEPLYAFLSAPLQACMPEGSKLIYTSPQGAFFTYMKVALVASLFGTSPFSFYQLWAFIAPGLYREEKRAVLPLAFFSSIFFLAGAAFCFFLVFPIAFQFFMGFATETIVPMISVEEYLTFALKLLLAFGVVFEMPLFAYFLSRFGILTPAFMRRSRRYAILVIFIVAAILTPPDVFSQCLMAIPMLLLYEVSIYVSAMAYKKKDDKNDKGDTTEKEEA